MTVLRASRQSHSFQTTGDIEMLQRHIEALPLTPAAHGERSLTVTQSEEQAG